MEKKSIERDGKHAEEYRYFISNLKADIEQASCMVIYNIKNYIQKIFCKYLTLNSSKYAKLKKLNE